MRRKLGSGFDFFFFKTGALDLVRHRSLALWVWPGIMKFDYN